MSQTETQVRERVDEQQRSGYAPVNGLQLYYEVHGAGQPVVLLHGAFMTIDTSWQVILPALAAQHQVIAVELQGHGRTADIDRPLRFETLADDVAALLDHLAVAQADIFGFSVGGGVALQLGIRHPERVRKLVVASASFQSAGMYPEVLAGVAYVTPEAFAGSPFEAEYLRLAPRPGDWPALIARMAEFNSQVQDWPAADIAGIAAPTLLVIGDSDIVRPEHAVEMFRLLGGGVPGDLAGLPVSQLAIIPGTTHIGLLQQSDVLLPLIERFLSAPMPQRA